MRPNGPVLRAGGALGTPVDSGRSGSGVSGMLNSPHRRRYSQNSNSPQTNSHGSDYFSACHAIVFHRSGDSFRATDHPTASGPPPVRLATLRIAFGAGYRWVLLTEWHDVVESRARIAAPTGRGSSHAYPVGGSGP